VPSVDTSWVNKGLDRACVESLQTHNRQSPRLHHDAEAQARFHELRRHRTAHPRRAAQRPCPLGENLGGL